MTSPLFFELVREVSARTGTSTILTDSASGQRFSLEALLKLAEAIPPTPAPRTASVSQGVPGFLAALLSAWRDGAAFCALEPGQAAPNGLFDEIPAGTVHIKLTSGSEGAPRRVFFTAENLLADCAQIMTSMRLHEEIPNLAAISLAHSYGFSNLVLPLLIHGVPMIAAANPLPAALARELRESPVPVCLPAVPALWRAWWQGGALDSGKIHTAISAGAPLPLDWERAVFEETGLKLHNFYGSSECGGIAYDRTEEPRTDPRVVGTPMDLATLDVSQEGFLRVTGPACGSGVAGLSDGVFMTSDLAARNEQGEILLLGRGGDLIHIAGRKLSPETVEQELRRIRGVRECLVFGVPSQDPGRGEEIVAVLSGENLTAGALKSTLSEQLPAWCLPRHWWIIPDLKPDSRGKLSRADWKARWRARA